MLRRIAAPEAGAGWRPDRRVVVAGFAALLLASTLVVLTHSGIADAALVDDVRADAEWILQAQFTDGAIANYVDKQAVWPYLANFAASGLARARELTGNRRYSDAAWRWLAWYQSKMDASGFVTDYVFTNGALRSNGFMDSTDSYAATFLLAIRDNYRATKDLVRLRNLKTGIVKAVGAIEATQQPDGLTWAKPDWKAKYLMDQAETYAGLRAAADLANLLKDSALAQRATSDANRMKAGVDALWNPTTQAYDWAVHEDGKRVPTNWSFLYSDSLQQPWAVAFGLVEPVRASALLTKFNASQPNWALPAATGLFSDGTTQTVGYWPEAGRAFAQIKSPVAPNAVTTIRAGALSAKRAWPFTTGNAGQLITFAAYVPALSMLPAAGTAAEPAPTSTSSTTVAPRGTQATTPTTAAVPVTSAPARVLASGTARAPAPAVVVPQSTTTTTTAPPPLVSVGATVGPLDARARVGGGELDVSVSPRG